MKKSEYQRYLASREWAILKQKVAVRSKRKCERCMVGTYDATHHLTYERIGQELPEDLLAVCEACHKYLSGKSNYDPSLTTANLADHAFTEVMNAKPDLPMLHDILKSLGEEDFALELRGLFCEIATCIEERFMPALCEHFEKWREADREWKEIVERAEIKRSGSK